MRTKSATERLIGALAFSMLVGWASQAHAQLGVGTTWVRTDEQGKGVVLNIEACCNGGRRLVYHLPPRAGQPASTMSIDSPMNGAEAPTLIAGKPSGQTMAIKRVDDHHVTAILKVNGQQTATYSATVSPDDKSMTVEGVIGAGSQTLKVTETWVRK